VTVIETLKSSLEVTQGHWKWYIRKLGCSFLLALHSNCGRIFSCFDTIHERERHPTTTRQQERSRATNVSNQTVFWYSVGLFFTFSECLGLQVMLDGRMIDRLITCDVGRSCVDLINVSMSLDAGVVLVNGRTYYIDDTTTTKTKHVDRLPCQILSFFVCLSHRVHCFIHWLISPMHQTWTLMQVWCIGEINRW